jgi:hypothetical protein
MPELTKLTSLGVTGIAREFLAVPIVLGILFGIAYYVCAMAYIGLDENLVPFVALMLSFCFALFSFGWAMLFTVTMVGVFTALVGYINVGLDALLVCSAATAAGSVIHLIVWLLFHKAPEALKGKAGQQV